jgi:ferric-dicitrate binding protein FerR (iron transport regulator)
MQIPNALLHAIEHYLEGKATPGERQLVQEWYHSFNDDEVEIPVNIIELRTKVAERIWLRLSESVQHTEPETTTKVIPIYRRNWIRASAAAVILLLFVAGWYYLSGKTNKNPIAPPIVTKPVQHDVDPGGDKAILTLDDGRKIVLDSAANGMLSQQGRSQVVKLADGQVVYNTGNPVAAENFPITYNTLTTPKGGQYKLTLPDGSEVWLNAASSIRYPTTFIGNERKVEITGEVYFEVKPIYTAGNMYGKKMPFIVLFGSTSAPALDVRHRIEVVGTHFNVMAYDDEKVSRTTLLEGSIKIQPETPNGPSTWLVPGLQAQITPDLRMTVDESADLNEVVAWKNGLFQFRDTDIETIMRQFSRWYDIDVKYAGAIPSMKLTGKAPRNISLASMLKILALSDVKYQIEGRVLTILP